MPTAILSRRAARIAVACTLLLFVVGATAVLYAVCSTNAYSVTSSAPPPSANWTTTAGLWTPTGGFPGCASGDTAQDTNASPTTIYVNSSIPNPIAGMNFNCAGCVVDVQSGGQLTLAGPATFGSGSTFRVEPGGTLTLASGGTLTMQSGSTFDVSGGYVDVQNGAQLTLAGSSSVTSSGTVNVNGGTMTVNSSLAVDGTSALTLDGATVDGSGAINNAGSVTQSGTDSNVSATFNNTGSGSVTVSSGTLHLMSGTGDAPFSIGSGAILDFPSGSYTLTANGTVSGAGTLQVSGGTLSIGGVTSPNGFTMTAGTLTGPGFLTANAMTWSGGTLTGNGGTQLNGSGSGTFDGASGNMLLDGRAFNDYGYISYTTTTNSLSLANGATLSVYGTFDIQNDGSIQQGVGGGTVVVAPNGFLLKSGGSGTSTIFPQSANTAQIYAASGTLALAGDGSHSGSFYVNSGATLAFTASSSTISGFAGGDGTFSFPAGNSYVTGTYSVTGSTSITGGYLEIDSSASTDGFTLTSGTLKLQNSFSMSGSGTWSGGTISGSDTFDVQSGATLTIDCATGNALLASATLQNDGTVNYTAAANNLALSSGKISNNGLFDIQTDQAIIVAAPPPSMARRARPSSIIIIGTGTITNNSGGTFQKSAGTSTTIAPVFTNAGTVLALSGTMNFTGGYTQTAGTTTLGPGGITTSTTLQLSGGVLNGAGTLTGDLQNDANVSPGSTPAIGTISVTGNYTQGSGGTLTEQVGGTSSFDQLSVGGAATLDGTLNVSLINSFTPANGDPFPVLTFASRSGDFAVKNLPTFSGTHGSFTASYTPTELDLVAVVTPSQSDLYTQMSGPASVNAGSPASYTITITNLGADSTSGTTTVTDTLPAGATSASASGTGWSCGAPSGGVITCTSTAVIANGSTCPTLTVSMTAPANGAAVTNSATTSNVNDPNGANNSASVNTTVVSQADLQIVKSGPNGVIAGQNITYSVAVTNNGPSTASSVVVSDPTPANLTFVSNSGGCTGAYPCSLGALAAGQTVTITSTYSTSPSFAGNVSNTATVSSPTADPNNTNDSSTKTTNVGAQADLSITKSGPANANAGQNVVYTITFSNAGPSPATNVTISDPTPTGMAFLSNSGACTTPFPCAIGTLNAGQSGTITSTYTIPPNFTGASVTNVANISATENDPNGGNNVSGATTNVAQPADVSITKTGPTTATPGQNVTYTITVTNSGPASAGGVTVNDPTPAGTTFVSNTGACTTPFPCSLGTMTAGQTATINATFNIPPASTAASVTNTATVSSGATDPSPSNNSASATTSLVPQADVSISKSGPASVAVGQNVVYVTTVTNNGPLPAANVFVTDPTPAGLTFVSNSGACSGTFPCALGTLASGQAVTITSTYNVPANYSGTSITNTASVSSSTFDGNTGNNASIATTAVTPPTPNADLRIAKTGPSQATAASMISFNVVVTNLGPTNATNVVVTDPTPSGLVFTGMSGTSCTSFPCTIASMAAGSTVTITSNYTIPSQTHGTVTNTAHVSSSTTDPNSANNTASASVFVYPVVSCPGFAPALVAPAANATTTSPVTFTWSSVSNATGYTLNITGGGNPPVGVTTSSTTATVTLASGNYSWSVTANGPQRCAPETSEARAVTVCNAVAAPVASAVAESTSGQTFAVQWTAIPEATGYELQESADDTFTTVNSFNLNGLTKTFTKNAQIAAPLFYRVRAMSFCGQPGAFSRPVSVVVIPLPNPDDRNINVNVPNGSKDPVTFQVRIPGLPGGTTSFVASVDKPWLSVTPTSGIVGPDGVLVTVSEDPSSLSNGTWTGTLLIVYGSSVVTSRARTEATTSTAIPLSISLVTPVTPAGFGTPSASALIIPSAGHIAGTSTSSWRSDVRVANTTLTALNYLLTFNPAAATTSGVKQTTINVAPGATTALDDIVRNWFGIGSLGDSMNGVLTVQQLATGGGPAASALGSFVSSRVYNATAAGTFGQFMPATSFSSFIGKGATSLSLQQLAQSASFHTNLGLVEASGKAASTLISVFDAAGTKLLDLPISLAGGEQKQLNSFLAANGISLDNGRVEAKVISGDGQITAYASVIDSNTSDPLLVSGVPLGGPGTTRFVVPGVATLDTGLANWRSDIRIFNSSNTPQTTTLTLYPMGSGDARTQSVTVNPGEVKALDDVVRTTFGASNLAGALHVTTAVNAPLIVTARTYDQTSHGTLGQFVPAVTLADSAGLGDRPLQILQAEDSVRFRTNVGVAEVNGKPATVEIAVTLPDSRVTPKIQLSLAPYQSAQLPIISSLGLGATYNARISVRVVDGDGKVAAYGSVVDQTTQDATYVPAQ